MGDLKESAPSIPEWMKEKQTRRRVVDYDDAAANDNVRAGLDWKTEF